MWNWTRWCCPPSSTFETLSLNESGVSAGRPTIMSTKVGIPSCTNRRCSSAYVSSEMFCRLIASSTSGVVVWIEMFTSAAMPASAIVFIVRYARSVAFFVCWTSTRFGQPWRVAAATIASAISTSRGRIPKFASAMKMYSIRVRGDPFRLREMRSRSKRLTLAAIAEPQSQNVHWNGQPRFVSQTVLQVSRGAAISGAKTPSRNGDGTVDEVRDPRPSRHGDEPARRRRGS